MTVTRHTLTGGFVDPDGNAYPDWAITAYVETNLAAGVGLIDSSGHQIQLGTIKLDLDDNGGFTTSLVASNSGSVTPTGIQYQVVVSYPDFAGNGRHDWASGWFDLTADTTLDAVATTSFVPPDFQSDFLAAAQALLDQQIDLSNIDTSDDEVAGLITNGTLGPLTRAALSASFTGHGSNLTTFLAGLPPGTEYVYNLTDGAGTLLDIVSGVA